MDYQRLSNERITGTKIAPYDMITAITQRSLNKQLAKMHQVNESLQTLSVLSADPDDNYSRLDADLDAPTIELCLNTENRIVIFCLNISRATFKYCRLKGRKVVEKSVEIPASTIALSVNLSFESVDFANLPQHVRDRLKVKDNYSVQRLLLDFTGARLDKRRTTVYDRIEDFEANAFFDIFIQQSYTGLSQKNEIVLHYVPLANQDFRKRYEMPSVPPTGFTFQNMPFVQNDKDNGGPSEDNMLVILQMCNDNAMPKQDLPMSKNWVVPTPNNADRYDGTVALSANTFLNGWLLKNLSNFNRDSTWIVTSAYWKAKGLGTVFNLDGKLGRTDASESDLKWNALDSTQVDQNVRNKVNGQAGQWYKYYHYSSMDDDEGLWRVWQKGTTTNWLFIPEGYSSNGKCEIFIYGNTFIEFYVHVDIPTSTGWVNGEWSTKIVLDGVNDGELIIKADGINPKITNEVNEAWLHSGDISTFTKPTEEGLKRLSMTYLIDEMQSVFKNGWDFVLPGGADFYISKAAFNREKDLMCELKYKFRA